MDYVIDFVVFGDVRDYVPREPFHKLPQVLCYLLHCDRQGLHQFLFIRLKVFLMRLRVKQRILKVCCVCLYLEVVWPDLLRYLLHYVIDWVL